MANPLSIQPFPTHCLSTPFIPIYVHAYRYTYTYTCTYTNTFAIYAWHLPYIHTEPQNILFPLTSIRYHLSRSPGLSAGNKRHLNRHLLTHSVVRTCVGTGVVSERGDWIETLERQASKETPCSNFLMLCLHTHTHTHTHTHIHI